MRDQPMTATALMLIREHEAALKIRYDDHRVQIAAAMAATTNARPHIGGLAEFILPPDLLVCYRLQQIFEAAGVEYDD